MTGVQTCALPISGQHYQDRLFQALPEFFHHTLAGYYADRYQDMEQVINKLEEIEKYADTVVPFLISSQVNCPPVLVGREAELEALDDWMNRGETNCLFLTGMGGIGKSSLVKKYIAVGICICYSRNGNNDWNIHCYTKRTNPRKYLRYFRGFFFFFTEK